MENFLSFEKRVSDLEEKISTKDEDSIKVNFIY